jgi:hypothetical protein
MTYCVCSITVCFKRGVRARAVLPGHKAPGMTASRQPSPASCEPCSPATGVHCRGDSRGYSSDSAMAITALEKHNKVDRSTWSSTRVRTLRR